MVDNEEDDAWNLHSRNKVFTTTCKAIKNREADCVCVYRKKKAPTINTQSLGKKTKIEQKE